MKITVLGAGAWGTALAIHFAKHGYRVSLWAHRPEHAADLREQGENCRYLPGFPFPAGLEIADDLAQSLEGSGLILSVTPTAALRETARAVRECGGGALPILAACKGFEAQSGLLPHQVLQQELPDNPCIGLLSGPSLAQELAQGLPCAVCLASENAAWIKDLAAELNTGVMRLYANTDVIGVAVGGAVKNVMAIATGLCDGLNCGLNARAALITRGLAEINRLAAALGAQTSTLSGLSGVGDLILTCTGPLSRNRQVGLGLAEGKTLQQVLDTLGHVAEGVPAIEEVYQTACRRGIDMPVTAMLYRLMHQELSPQDTVAQLMQRPPVSE